MSERSQRFKWRALLSHVGEARVVPVVGPDLLRVRVADRDVLLYRHLAERLAEELEIDPASLPPAYRLNDVAVFHRRQGGDSHDVYPILKDIIERLDPEIPAPLEKLARITHFKLFISTTFDSLLVRALDRVRFGGRETTARLANPLFGTVQDLPGEIAALDRPHVYQIFGPLSSSPDYAVTEEETLEFIHLLQTEGRRPKILFDELRKSHLLFIGCSYSDWLARFFIRTVRNERLALPGMTETIADDRTPSDERLVIFLETECEARIFTSGNAAAFVDELYRRWQERYPSEALPEAPGGAESSVEEPAPAMKPEAVFLSYASEDRKAVLRMKQSLETVGLDVWFDQDRLRSGQNWEETIRRNIEQCAFFLPFISHTSVGRTRGIYRKEWSWAIEEAPARAEDPPFIHPIVIDDTPPSTPDVPRSFTRLHWNMFVGGAPPPEFSHYLKRLVRELRLRKYRT